MPQPTKKLPRPFHHHQGWKRENRADGRVLWLMPDPHSPGLEDLYLTYDWSPEQMGWVLDSSYLRQLFVQGTPEELAAYLVTYILTKEWPRVEEEEED